jgi:dTDP-glucose pyrophosphorylase
MAAGRGTRNNSFINLHKALLPLANRPVISYILDCIGPNTEVVIALGHLRGQLQSYLEYVYPHHSFTFVNVDNYDGPGAGRGYSLLQCKEHLDGPFIFSSIDTLFNAKLKKPDHNWIGVARLPRPQLSGYCLVDIGENGYVRKLYYNPDEAMGNHAFIGIAGIYDHEKFWQSLADRKTINNEHQVINGFHGLDVRTKPFRWYDTGTEEKYKETLKHFPPPITTPKTDGTLYIDNDKVVKFFSDSEVVKDRVKRATALVGCAPAVKMLSAHTYGYEYVLGNLLSHVYDEQMLGGFIRFCEQFFTPSGHKTPAFTTACHRMYRLKTYERIRPLEYTEPDIAVQSINGIRVLPIGELLAKVDWDAINEKAIPFNFHGDFQPENIVMDWGRITLLDWRDSFGGDLAVGDLYYDLGKLYHALIVNGTNITDGKYCIDVRGANAFLNIDVRYNLMLLRKKIRDFCLQRGFDWGHVKLLGALQYITIASLYEDRKYREFLFLFGKLCLTKSLETINAQPSKIV